MITVSCIMPTRDRRAFVPGAVLCFLRQDHAGRELIVVDDGDDPVADLVPAGERFRYVRLRQPMSLGGKRNLACELARGELIAHWDDDDWYAPWRLRHQISELDRWGADVTGLATLLHYEPGAGRAWRYTHPPGAPAWLAGNTLLYRRARWHAHPFPDVRVGEDARFIRACPAGRVRAVANHRVAVALIHDGNTFPKQPTGPRWTARPVAEVRRLTGPRWPAAIRHHGGAP